MAAACRRVSCHQCSVPPLGLGLLSANKESWTPSLPHSAGAPSNRANANAGALLCLIAHRHKGTRCCEPILGQDSLAQAGSRICCDASVNEAQGQSNADVGRTPVLAHSRRQTLGLLGASLAPLSWIGAAPEALAFPGPSDTREAEPQV